jgi:hypothetical protein
MSKSAVAGVVRAMVWRLADLQAERGLWAEGANGPGGGLLRQLHQRHREYAELIARQLKQAGWTR